MTDLHWRNKAKDALYGYQVYRKQLREIENDVLFRGRPAAGARYSQGCRADNTARGALLLCEENVAELEKRVRAVRALLGKLSTGRRVDQDRLALLNLVYFRQETGLYGAALRLDISERTAKRWNDQALRFIGQHMGWLE